MKALTKLKDDARKHEQKEEWDKAIQLYLEVIRTAEEGEGDSELPLYNRVGDLYVRLGRPTEAVGYYEKAADRYAEAGLFNNAIALCNKALRYLPNRTELLRKLGQFSASQGFITEARRWYLEYAERKLKEGALDEAFQALDDFASVHEDADVREMLGRHLLAYNRREHALRELKAAHQLRVAAGQTDAAVRLMDEILTIEPDAFADTAAPAPDSGAVDATQPNAWDEPAVAEAAADEPTTDPGLQTGADVFGAESSDSLLDLVTFNLPGFEANQVPAPEPTVEPLVEDIPLESVDAPSAEIDVGLVDIDASIADFPVTAEPDFAPIDLQTIRFGDETGLDAAESVTDAGTTSEVDHGFSGASVDEADSETELADITVASFESDSGLVDFSSVAPEEEASSDTEDVLEPLPLIDTGAADEDEAPIELPLLDELPAFEPTGESENSEFDEIESDAPAPLPFLSVEEQQEHADLEITEPSPVDTEPVAPAFNVDAFGNDAEFEAAGAPAIELPAPEDEAAQPAADSPQPNAIETFQFEEPTTVESSDPVAEAVDPEPARPEADFEFEKYEDDALVPDWTETLAAALDFARRGETAAAVEELIILHESLAADHMYAEALQVIDELVRLEPASISHLQQRVEYASKVGDTPVLIRAYLDLADRLARSGASMKANAIYQRVLDIDPDNAIARNALYTPPSEPIRTNNAGYVDLFSLLAEEEEESTRFVVAEKPPTGDEERDFADMLSQFKQKLAEHVPFDDSSSHYDLGLAFKEMGLIDEAIAEFQTALKGGQDRLKIYEELGHCFLLKQQYNIAINILNRALSMGADDADLVGIYYHIGRSYEELGQRAEAKTAYEHVVGVDISFRDAAERLARL